MDGAFDVALLRTFVAASEQQHDASAFLRVINPVSGPDIDPQFPHTISAKPAVAKIGELQPIDASNDVQFSANIPQRRQPRLINVAT
jgi:hypothetical protein